MLRAHYSMYPECRMGQVRYLNSPAVLMQSYITWADSPQAGPLAAAFTLPCTPAILVAVLHEEPSASLLGGIHNHASPLASLAQAADQTKCAHSL